MSEFVEYIKLVKQLKAATDPDEYQHLLGKFAAAEKKLTIRRNDLGPDTNIYNSDNKNYNSDES